MRWLLKGLGDRTLISLLHVTPKTHLRVSDQPILDLRRRKSNLSTVKIATVPEIRPQSYLRLAFQTCVSDRQTRALSPPSLFPGTGP